MPNSLFSCPMMIAATLGIFIFSLANLNLVNASQTQIEFVDSVTAASNTLNEMVFKEDDELLVIHHCKLTTKTLKLMLTIQTTRPETTFVMVKAPYNGPGKDMSVSDKNDMKSLGMVFTKVWNFLPENAARRLDENDIGRHFLPPQAKKAQTYGMYQLLQYHTPIQHLAKKGYDMAKTIYDDLLTAASAMNGFTKDEFYKLAEAVKGPNNQTEVENFFKRRADFLSNNPISKDVLDKAIDDFSKDLITKFSYLKEEAENFEFSGPFAIMKACVVQGGRMMNTLSGKINAYGKAIPIYKNENEMWMKTSVNASEAEHKIPRALTKGLESFFAPFEGLSYDGAAVDNYLQEKFEYKTNGKKAVDTFKNHPIIQIHDGESDDVGAVQGMISLNLPESRHATIFQMSTHRRPNVTLKENDIFLEFLKARCAARNQKALYVFADAEGRNQRKVLEGAELYKDEPILS